MKSISKSSLVLFGAALVAAVVFAPASLEAAHHAAAGIDQTRTVTVEGTVREFRWANPHSWIEMDVVNEDGETEVWNFEMNPPSFLVGGGWTRSTIAAGDVVKVEARPFINGDPGGIFVSITLPNGEQLGGRGGGGARGGARGGAARGGRGN
jgi:Family of unknown function (DUF6152)